MFNFKKYISSIQLLLVYSYSVSQDKIVSKTLKNIFHKMPYRTLNCPEFEWIQYLGIQFLDAHCINKLQMFIVE